MNPPQPFRFLFSTGVALAVLSSSGAGAEAGKFNVVDCQIRAVHACSSVATGNQYEDCYIEAYNRCIRRKFFLKPALPYG